MTKIASKQDIINTVSIVKLAEEAGIPLEECVSGNFDLRCKCPAKDHKGGNERTASLYIDSRRNNFYCYGCGASSNVLDFYMLLNDIEFIEAFRILRERAVPSGNKNAFLGKASNFSVLVEISEFFREQMLQNSKDLKWINGIMIKTDEYLEGIESTDVAKTKALLKSLKKTFKERYSA